MAASESRRLRRVIKEYVRRAEIANPQIKEARAKLINEFYGQDLTDPNYKPEPWKGAIPQMRERVLKFLGAKPFALGINPHGMQLDVTVKDPTGASTVERQDRLRFYDDGTAWSTNQARGLFYKATRSNKIEIYTDAAARDSGNKEAYFTGDITRVGLEAIYNIAGKTKEKKLDTLDKAEDIAHTVLDWVGFVPGLGDIADLVNAAWYFADAVTEDDPWLYVEGLLSLIAVLPLVGSGVKAAAKGAIEVANVSFKGFKNALRTSLKTGKDTHKLWKSIIDSGQLSKADLADLGTGLDTVRGIFNKNKSMLPDSVAKQLNNFSAWLKDSKVQIDELSGLSKQAADKTASSMGTLNKTVQGAADVAGKGVQTVSRIIPIPSTKITGLFKRFRRVGILPDEKMITLAKAMEKRFADEMADPTKLMVLLKTTPNPDILVRKLSQIKGADAIIQKYIKNLPSGSRSSLLTQRNSRAIQGMFRELKKDPGIWERTTRYVADHAMDNNSFVWNMYKTNATKELSTILSKRYMGGEGIKGLIPNKADVKSFRKWVDIVYNELHDAGEDITKDEIADNPTGVIYPFIKYSLQKTLPGTYEDVKTIRDKAVENPLVKVGLSTLGYSVKDGSVQQTRNVDYDPFGEAGGRFD